MPPRQPAREPSRRALAIRASPRATRTTHDASCPTTAPAIGTAATVPPPPRRQTEARTAGHEGTRHSGDATPHAGARRRSGRGATARRHRPPSWRAASRDHQRGQSIASKSPRRCPVTASPMAEEIGRPSAGKGSQGSSRAGPWSGGEPERRRGLGVGTRRLAGTALPPEPRGAAAARESETSGRRSRGIDRRRFSSVGADPHRHRDDEQADRDERSDILKKVGHESLPFLSMGRSCSCFVPFASRLSARDAPH